MDTTAPIGFFDSGIGGLSVLKHAMQVMPNENFIFFGDNGNLPYGEKSEAQIKKLTIAGGDFLFEKGVKAMLVACNTATSAAIHDMRDKYKMPVISMEPAIKPACAAADEGKVMVLATPSTIASARYKRLVERLGCGAKIIDIPCGGLADMLDTGDFKNPAIDAYLEKKMLPYVSEEIDGIVIGCTHYSFVAETIAGVAAALLPGKKTLFDGMFGTVRQLKNVLQEHDMLSPGPGGEVEVHTSGTAENLQVMQKIVGI